MQKALINKMPGRNLISRSTNRGVIRDWSDFFIVKLSSEMLRDIFVDDYALILINTTIYY